jgi:uncharacterized protein YybS (DUF2232 family)
VALDARVRVMSRYVLTAAVLFLLCVAATLLNLNPVATALFPIPVAVYVARGFPNRAAGLVACAGLAALVCGGDLRAFACYVSVAVCGAPLGLGLARRWTYGWTVTAVAALLYLAVVGNILAEWRAQQAEVNALCDAWIGDLEKQAKPTGESAPDNNTELLVRNMRWLKDHWPDIGLGSLLLSVLAAACIAVSALSAWFRRRFGAAGVRGSFRTMRTSEWLVWAAILAAGLCFVDSRWPELALRRVSWNAAVALAAIYWLNGLSVLVYALSVLHLHVVAYVAVFLLLISFGVHPVLCFVGLFDTWGDFRRAVDKLAAAAEKRRNRADADK